MHSHSIDPWTHEHVFLGAQHSRNERRTWFVVALTAVMMIGEIAAGTLFGSMALLADGWHMATHAAALGIAAVAYLFCPSARAQFALHLRHRKVRRSRGLF
jgi:Co/Zn/Cd efflux system component